MADRPARLRLSRARGFNLQEASHAVNGRPAIHAARPGPLGNPFIVGKHGDRARCVELHRYLLGGLLCLGVDEECIAAQQAHVGHLKTRLAELRGANLACWCALPAAGEPDLCHAATLIEAANG